jgi:predicted phage terminase large subunit-like protein
MTRPITEVKKLEYNWTWTQKQKEVFVDANERFIIASAGRQSGKTLGAAQFLVKTCLSKKNQTWLWCDVSYNQILDLYDNYFATILKSFPEKCWSWHTQRRTLTFPLTNSIIRFRSADKPDMIVGSFYNGCIMNEAGIQFFDHPTIWNQIIEPTLLRFKDSRVFFIGTPRGTIGKNGKENVYYTIYKKGIPGNETYDPNYKSFQFTSYDNPYLSKENIAKIENDPDMAPSLKAQEMNGEFVDHSASCIFRQEWFQITSLLPPPNKQYKRFITLDTAFSEKTSSDESACTCWIKDMDGKFYAAECWHERLDFPKLIAKVRYTVDSFKAGWIVVEAIGAGYSLIQALRKELRDNSVNVVAWDPTGPHARFLGKNDKISRATSATAYISRGMLFLYKAPWNFEFIGQHITFPQGNKDDIVDTLSMAFQWARMSDPTNDISTVTSIPLPQPVPQIQNYKRYTQSYGIPLTERLRGFR